MRHMNGCSRTHAEAVPRALWGGVNNVADELELTPLTAKIRCTVFGMSGRRRWADDALSNDSAVTLRRSTCSCRPVGGSKSTIWAENATV